MKKISSQALFRFAYPAILTVISCYVLMIFIRPMGDVHAGLNAYYRSKFLDMVNGTAYKPFVYRTLLPTTVRLISTATPYAYRYTFNNAVEQQYGVIFAKLGWETSAAYEYVMAAILMLISFMGFAHYAAKLVVLTCRLTESQTTRLLLPPAILLCLPPFFRYTSFPYDPPQLFLFTLALYFLAAAKYRAFLLTFVLCCFNKETAVLLIPVFAITGYKKLSPARHYWSLLIGLLVVYLSIKSLITFAFHFNPGSLVEFQIGHNVDLFTRGWSFTGITTLFVLVILLSYQWEDKPAFLKVSFLCTLPPLMGLALFVGYLDEWRGYYEAYPIAFGLIVDSLLRIASALRQTGMRSPAVRANETGSEHAQAETQTTQDFF